MACGGGDDPNGNFINPAGAGDAGMLVPDTGTPITGFPTVDSGTMIPINTIPTQKPDSSVSTNPGSDAGTTDGGATTDSAVPGSDGGTTGDGGTGTGMCCSDGNCLCHGPVPTKLSGGTKGPFKTAMVTAKTGTIYYPTDAEPPFAAIALCAGFLNTGPEMTDWGPFYASYGIVVLITTTDGADFPDDRATKLLASIAELKAITSGPLAGKLSGRYGTSGYSMGGGGTLIAANKTPSLLTSVSLAAWGPDAAMDKVPSLLLCGTDDIVAPCSDHTDPAYAQIPSTTPKMKMVIDGGDHLAAWFGPADGGGGISGGYALAFQKVFLEGDTRWKPLLLTKPSGSTQETNIK
jgi:hypothetical protein